MTFDGLFGMMKPMTDLQMRPLPSRFDDSPTEFVAPQMSLAEALARLNGSSAPALPIVAADTGEVLGMLTRPAPPSPPRLGGMATPLGVYLTDGVRTGGVGFWGLFLTGLALSVMAVGAQATISHLLPNRVWAWLESPTHSPALAAWLSEMTALLPACLIFVFLRLSPMAGTHAAEHQVVHCIERGLPLLPDWVRTMPRVHPRCGTNLFVGITLFLLLFLGAFCASQSARFGLADSATLALALSAPLTLALWRRLGGWVQQHLATRPATDRQIESAIRAAEDVLARRAASFSPPRFRAVRRIWTMGLLQVLLGYFSLLGLLLLASRLWPALDVGWGL